MQWDPVQYGRYADERGRPFLDLLGRIGAVAPRRVLDVGCGTGALTALLAERWPEAQVEGVDSSPDMIGAAVSAASASGAAASATAASAAAASAARPKLSFQVADAADRPTSADLGKIDVLISNATLQWVPDHRRLLARWAAGLPDGGWLAVQVPGNFESPSHTLMRSLAESARWRTQLDGVLRHDDAVATPAEYAHLLLSAGLVADVWETTYLHVLSGADPVLEWVRGTGLRPVLAALSADDAAEFEAEYATQLRAAYPPGPHGTLFAFRRIFAVGHRP